MDSKELYNRYLQGDEKALEQLVVEYGDSLAAYAYCFLHDFSAAEDVMEDTFATLIANGRKYVERSLFDAYLFRIARNKCIDRLRKRKREVSLCEDVAATVANVEEDALRSVRDETVYKALLTLPRDYRSVLYLMYYRDFTVEEIHTALKKSRKQVYNLIARARASLKEILIREGIGYEDF